MSENTTRQKWVYVGLDVDIGQNGGKVTSYYVWAELVEPDRALGEYRQGDIGNKHYFKGRKNIYAGRPGIVCSFLVGEKDGQTMSVLTQDREFVGMWPDSGQISEWQNASRAKQRLYTKAREARKVAHKEEWKEALEPIRRAYQHNRRARAEILAAVLEYITGA